MPQTEARRLTLDEFYDRFRPVPHPRDPYAPFWCCMLETYGEDLEHVHRIQETMPNTVWTVLDCDGELIIASGYHHVNRMGYIITEVPYGHDEIFEVYDD